MGYVLTVYNEKRYREFFLWEQRQGRAGTAAVDAGSGVPAVEKRYGYA